MEAEIIGGIRGVNDGIENGFSVLEAWGFEWG